MREETQTRETTICVVAHSRLSAPLWVDGVWIALCNRIMHQRFKGLGPVVARGLIGVGKLTGLQTHLGCICGVSYTINK